MGEAALNLPETSGQDVLDAFKPHEHFSKCLLDAFAVVDMTGRVLKCNALLSLVTGQKTKQIMKAGSLAELLTFDIKGMPLTVAEILNNQAPYRYDDVTGTATINNQSLNLTIGVFPFIVNGANIGAFVLLRDVTAETNLQDRYKDKATQSITDNLTGLFNRAYFSEYLTNQVKVMESMPADSEQRTMSVIMFDIDHFKKINDVYGHQAGDFVLKHVGGILKNGFRKTDVVARYGGEEFLAILPATPMSGAAGAAEKIRESIATFKFDMDGTVIPVTISIGLAQMAFSKETAAEAIARADAALYFSKKTGRNRVSAHNGTEPQPVTPEAVKPS
mgnify:CR=1 FL=1